MHTSFNRMFARGFSLVELMVAMVIGLIGIIIIFQVFEVSEGIKRTTTSGGDAQQSGAIAMYVLEHDVRNSGMGVNDTPFAGCSIVGWDNTVVPSDLPAPGATMMMVPVRLISYGNSRIADELTIYYGSQTHSASATTLNSTMLNSTDPIIVKNPYGFQQGDLIMLMQRPPSPGVPTQPCSLMEVTNKVSNVLSHDVGTYTVNTPTGAVSYPSRFNKPGGLGINYSVGTTGALVYNLGNIHSVGNAGMPVYSNYRIQNSALTLTSGFTVGTPPVVAENIVHMRAAYGLDDGINNNTVTYNVAYAVNDGIVDRWVDAATAPNWQYVVAIRVAVVARSALKEKPTAGMGAACDTTAIEPSWSGTAWSKPPLNFNTRLDLTADPDWMCYRYRVFEATIPIRNWAWSSS